MVVKSKPGARSTSADAAPSSSSNVEPKPDTRRQSLLKTAVSRTPTGSVPNDLLSAGFEALDLLGIGLLVCSASGGVLAANQIGEQILAVRDGMELDSEGLLSTTHGCGPSLREVVARVAAQSGDAGSTDVALALRRPSSKRALTVRIRSIKEDPRSGQPAGRPAALVLILDSALPANTVEAELRQLYGLTATETRLAKLLMEGIALDDCCHQLGIRRTTGRMHLRNLFAKTGVSRQGELVSLLLKSIGLGPRKK